jgi:hypothetical protein
MFATAEDRWDRVAQGTLWLAVMFVAVALHGIWEGDNFAGVAMTMAPAILLFGISRLAAGRRDQLIYDTPASTLCWLQRIGALALVAIGVLYIGFKMVAGLGTTVGEDLALDEIEQPAQIMRMSDDVEIGYKDVQLQDGSIVKMKTLVRKQRDERYDDNSSIVTQSTH